ncbi:hypothetical protein [Nostoc sp.]|uniref:hypothetical protein n=1 Tax=Nostoc sp. TaxID=1180 RepID=UPI002FF6AFA1
MQVEKLPLLSQLLNSGLILMRCLRRAIWRRTIRLTALVKLKVTNQRSLVFTILERQFSNQLVELTLI